MSGVEEIYKRSLARKEISIEFKRKSFSHISLISQHDSIASNDKFVPGACRCFFTERKTFAIFLRLCLKTFKMIIFVISEILTETFWRTLWQQHPCMDHDVNFANSNWFIVTVCDYPINFKSDDSSWNSLCSYPRHHLKRKFHARCIFKPINIKSIS